jgi:hypothetical protein
MGAALSQPKLLDHPGRSQRPIRDDRSNRTQTVLLRAALSELQRSESLPMVHFISLSLRPFLAPCACSVSALLQFSSELHCQSCNAQSPPLPSKTLRGTPSMLAVSVWPLRERLGQSTVTVTVNRYRYR